MESGDTYFKLYRKIYDNGLWTDPITLRLFLWVLGQAVYDVKGLSYSNVVVHRGQYLRSYRKLQEDLEYVHNRQIKKYPLSTLTRAVDKLIEYKIITKLETELGTLFTVINYDKYQPLLNNNATSGESRSSSKQDLGTEPGTTCEQLTNNNNKDKKGLLCQFDEARKIYPGTKRGLKTEYDDFTKKHKDCSTVIHLLKPAIERQIKNRESLNKRKEFTPAWKNFKTWISQRCWEEEVSSENTVVSQLSLITVSDEGYL